MLTREPAESREHGAYVDVLGYAYCPDCAARGRGKGERRWCPITSLGVEVCDGCERDVRDCAPRVTTGTALVEHVKCKIF